jgi:hypothetical protein
MSENMDESEKAPRLHPLVRFGLKCLAVIIVVMSIKAFWPAVTASTSDPNARPPESATERTSRQLKEIEDAVKAIQSPNKPSDQN